MDLSRVYLIDCVIPRTSLGMGVYVMKLFAGNGSRLDLPDDRAEHDGESAHATGCLKDVDESPPATGGLHGIVIPKHARLDTQCFRSVGA